MSYFIGTDIGGTFTDLVMLSEAGEVTIVKAPTTPDDRTRGVLDAMDLAAKHLGIKRGELISQLEYFAHGTTAATNAFIERKGAKTGLLTTRGFADILAVQRCMAGWAGMLDHEIAHYSARSTPQPIVPRALIEEVDERVDYKGRVIVPLDEAVARDAIRRLVKQGVEAIAVMCLWSFRNPSHEQRIEALIREEAPNVFVTISSSLIPILGEYERVSTTAINSYLGPVIHRYINGLEASMRQAGYNGPVSIMESGGGVLPASEAAYQAANLLTSGPAGGVLASQKLGEQIGFKNIITADMGGTSFDVGLIVDGQPTLQTIREEGRFHVALPSIKVTAIGAGGGSIARLHAGQLFVGPESAGAVPGPACYGRGGTEPTITDADVVLGVIDPKYFLGGQMSIDVAKAEAAVRDKIATPLGMDLHEAAAGIREVANNKMADLLRRVTTWSGHDPRNFALCAYGGAGATHAHQFASIAGISTVIIPTTASGHSAFGAVTADRHRSFSLAYGQHTPPRFKKASDHIDIAALNAGFGKLDARCKDALGPEARIERLVGMLFRQQVHEVFVEVPNKTLDAADVDALVERFQENYEKLYGKGSALRGSGVEFTTLRTEAVMPVVRPSQAPLKAATGKAKPVASRRVYFYKIGFRDTAVYRSEDLGPGMSINGPAIVERPDTTVVIGVSQSLEIEPHGNMIMNLGKTGSAMMDAPNKLRSGVYEYERAAVDPVTFEVVRHRLVSISEEQAATLSAISGSPLVNDATDFNTGIFRAQGEIVTIGKTVLYHAASVAEMIKHIIADCEDEPGINPGDMFLVNHPYKGALHPPDFGLVAPVFHEGKRIAWIGVCAHQISVGGVPGPQARDVRDEGMLIPPLKAVEGGAFRHDVLAMVLGMSLAPNNMALDFRGFLSCNNVAIQRLAETIGQYGIDTVLSVMDGSIELSERAVRERLRELPDGVYRSQAFLDHDGIENKLYRISLEMTKTGDNLTLDFSKSSDQSPTFLNSTVSGLHAGIRAGMLPIISYDLPWNEGVFRPMKVVAREGSIVSAKYPAPVGQGPIGAMWLVESVVTEAFSRMMATHPKFIAEASAMPNGGPDTFNLLGKNQYGEPNRGGTLDQAHVGGGAYCHRDGLSPQGHRHIPAIRLQNIERAENNSPMMYLFRRFIPDTPGPGRHRGGVSVGHGYILHDTEKMGFVLSGHCYESPAGLGMFGGYPGACNTRRLQKNTNVRKLMSDGRLPKTSAEILGELQTYPAKMNRPGEFTQADVHENSPSSGGGWGDPIEREVQSVADDVRWNAVSRGAAKDIYGVVLTDAGDLDAKATESRRAAIRKERMSWSAPKTLADAPAKDAKSERLALFGDRASFERIAGKAYLRCACGSAFAPAGENWKLYAKQGASAAADLGPRSSLHDKLEAVRYACPACARLHAVEVKLKGEEPLFDMQIHL